MTQAATQVSKYLATRYPGIRFGRKSCRKIAGDDDWSQHAFYDSDDPDSNGLDIYGPAVLPSAAQQAFVSVVVEELEAYWEELAIAHLLWKVPDHFGHAHLDFFPYGIDRSSCDSKYEAKWRKSSGVTFWSTDPIWEGKIPMSWLKPGDPVEDLSDVKAVHAWQGNSIVSAADVDDPSQDTNTKLHIARLVNNIMDRDMHHNWPSD